MPRSSAIEEEHKVNQSQSEIMKPCEHCEVLLTAYYLYAHYEICPELTEICHICNERVQTIILSDHVLFAHGPGLNPGVQRNIAPGRRPWMFSQEEQEEPIFNPFRMSLQNPAINPPNPHFINQGEFFRNGMFQTQNIGFGNMGIQGNNMNSNQRNEPISGSGRNPASCMPF